MLGVLSMIGVVWIAFKVIAFMTKVRGAAATTLDSLSDLSKVTAAMAPTESLDWSAALTRSLDLSREARSYCSVTILKDRRQDRLKHWDHEVVRWRVDFVKPSRYHVTQQAWDWQRGELLEEWVSIAEENFQNSGFWICTEGERNQKLNQALSLEGLLAILDPLRDMKPVRIGVYQDLKERYLLLEYDTPASGGGLLKEVCREFVGGNCHVQIWIHLKTGFLAKAQFTIQGTKMDGELGDVEIHKLFACHNDNIKVEPPPWLNAVQIEGNKFEIVERRIPILRHHRSPRSFNSRLSGRPGSVV